MSEFLRSRTPDYVHDARINELIGLCNGVLADGVVTQQEAEFLLGWLDRNRQLASVWPGNVLYARIGEMLEDGVLDPDEEGELLGLLTDFTRIEAAGSAPTYLPLCRPMPELTVREQAFCLTGTFEYGQRKQIVRLIDAAGGECKGAISRQVDVLVIGNLVTPAWAHATYGRKIEAAAQARDAGQAISIVTEGHLFQALGRIIDI